MTKAYIDLQLARLSDLVYEVETCLVDLGETAEAVVSRQLHSRSFDFVTLGAGMRQRPNCCFPSD